jgi:FKBP-type peptidyl-prolyl cis-trans isomerase (trigger factor)
LWHVSLNVPSPLVAHIQDHVTHTYANYNVIPGMTCKHLPLRYTQQYFATEIERDTKQFVLEHFVNESIMHHLNERGVNVVNWPRLMSITGSASDGFTYTFAVSLAPDVDIDDWKTHTFIPPRRKNYTDLDIQVSGFIKQLDEVPAPTTPDTIEHGDWVQFKATLQSPHSTTPLNTPTTYWIHTAAANIPLSYADAFIGKSRGDQFEISATAFAQSLGSKKDSDYNFSIVIEDIIKDTYMPLTDLAESLSVPEVALLPDRLIEIFSLRNDISLRRAIIEELFYMLLGTYRFDIAPHAVTRRKELLLTMMQHTPDSAVYTKQKQFLPHIGLLAESKLKEESLIDAIALHEKISVTNDDIRHYIQMASHERLKEFVYFTPLTDDLTSSHDLLSQQAITHIVRREKTLNHVISQLAI